MRLVRLIPVAAFILLMSGPSFAQEWIEYYSRADFFLVNLPAQPKVQDITWRTEFGLTLPAHVHVYEDGASRYSVTAFNLGASVSEATDEVRQYKRKLGA